jgi:hypothetical protein
MRRGEEVRRDIISLMSLNPEGMPIIIVPGSLRKERAIHPRYVESYSDGELSIDVITDERVPEMNIGIKPGTGAGLVAFFKEKIVTEEPVYACVEDSGSIFPRPVRIDWSQPIELAWKKKEGTMGTVFRARIPPEKIDSLTFLQRRDDGLRVIYYWPQMFFDEGIERMERLPAAEIAALEFFFSYPQYMVGRAGFPNGVLVQWAREHGGDSRVRSFDPEIAITTFQ